MIAASSGIALILIYAGDCYQNHIEYTTKLEREVTITEDLLRSKFPKDQKPVDVQLHIYTAGQGELRVPSFAAARNAKHQLPNGFGLAYTSAAVKLGASVCGSPGKTDQSLQTLILKTLTKGSTLMAIRAHRTEDALTGLEFLYEDGLSQCFGNKEGSDLISSEFTLDARKGECLLGFCLKPGIKMEALTNYARMSAFFGKELGGRQ